MAIFSQSKNARILAVILCGLSLHRTVTGFFIYKAENAYRLNNFKKAALYSEKGLKLDPQNLELLFLQGRSNWYLYGENKDAELLEKAANYLDFATQLYPFWGRGWMYRGLVALEQGKASGKDSWRTADDDLTKAVQREPGNAWILNTQAQLKMGHWKELSSEEKKKAAREMSRSLAIKDSNQPSPYLFNSLDEMWTAVPDLEVIEAMIPQDVYSFQELYRFMSSMNLWKQRAQLFSRLKVLQGEAYAQQCAKADQLLRKELFERAYFEYQVAVWLDNSWLYAQVGMIAAGYPKRKWPFKVEEVLEKAFHNYEEDWRFLFPYLKRVLADLRNPELQKLYEERMSHPESLEPNQRTSAQIQGPQVLEAALWWNQDKGNLTLLDYPGTAGMQVMLSPGKNKITLSLRNASENKDRAPFVKIVLYRQYRIETLDEIYLENVDFKEFSFVTPSAGGKRWLQVELLNATDHQDPQVELGPVEIESVA